MAMRPDKGVVDRAEQWISNEVNLKRLQNKEDGSHHLVCHAARQELRKLANFQATLKSEDLAESDLSKRLAEIETRIRESLPSGDNPDGQGDGNDGEDVDGGGHGDGDGDDEEFSTGEGDANDDTGDLADQDGESSDDLEEMFKLSDDEKMSDKSSDQRRDLKRKGDHSTSQRPAKKCKYGANCYRRNPSHLKRFAHPPGSKSDILYQEQLADGDYARALQMSDVTDSNPMSLSDEQLASQLQEQYDVESQEQESQSGGSYWRTDSNDHMDSGSDGEGSRVRTRARRADPAKYREQLSKNQLKSVLNRSKRDATKKQTVSKPAMTDEGRHDRFDSLLKQTEKYLEQLSDAVKQRKQKGNSPKKKRKMEPNIEDVPKSSDGDHSSSSSMKSNNSSSSSAGQSSSAKSSDSLKTPETSQSSASSKSSSKMELEEEKCDDKSVKLEKQESDVKDWIHSTTEQESIEQPKNLIGGTLKGYQKIGLRWLVTLHNLDLNGILADEMGLGKTIQTIALLAYLRETLNIHGPHLIVIPLSVLADWTEALERWCPSLKVVVHRGTPQERRELVGKLKSTEFDVMITTYEMSMIDNYLLNKFKWHYIVVDEAHRLKNRNSKLVLILNEFSSEFRLLLTGTPLQNNIKELWALLNFILPDIFDSSESFTEWFSSPFDASKTALSFDEDEKRAIVDRFHRILRPFLLRRLKENVLKSLPSKHEVVVKCAMSGTQKALYKKIQDRSVLQMKTKVYAFNNVIMQLKKCVNHPYLFRDDEYEIEDEIIAVSGKFQLLDRIFPKLQKCGHRILIFCQMTRVMDILSEYLEYREYEFLRLDGSVASNDRKDLLKKFNEKDSKYFIFLLSTRAGGLGVNLQTADTVILFDSDWNPQMDKQAQARAHRIGQTKDVLVIRFVCVGSVEEKIIQRAQSKLKMEKQLITAGQFDYTTEKKEREAFFTSILRQQSDLDADLKEIPDDEQLNKIISRGDEEFETFQKIDEVSSKENVQLQMGLDLPHWLNLKDKKKVREQVDEPIDDSWKRTRTGKLYVATNADNEESKDTATQKKKTKKKREKTRKRRRLSDVSAQDDLDLTYICQLCSEPCQDFELLQIHMLTTCPVYADAFT